MKLTVIVLFALTSFLFFTALLQALLLSDKRVRRRMKRYLDLQDKRKLPSGKLNVLVQMQLYKQTVRDKVLSKKRGEKLADMLHRAGVPLKPEEYILLQWMLSALCGGLLFLLSGRIVLLLIGIAAGYSAPRMWVKRKERERTQAFGDALQDMITTVIGSLRAGFSFSQALKTVVDESDGPMKEEMETVLREMQYGSSMEDALLSLKERMPSEDLNLMIQAILIQRQVGGNLATVLETIVQTIRDRVKIQRQVKTLTAQGRLSGMVIGLLPIALGLIIYLIEPNYIGSLFRHPIGVLMLCGGTVSGIIGFFMIRKLTTIEV
ncbi:type II secretion system protein [Gordoniibacillus kamchatkensis]|uniref:Type II secretion system protein n=1 Tax=Gordoniibacillus kamchatkensis TaxID=1590651 RepID=A0ABR5ABB7_9BACL|nr:type II secretion system F family protein [Paenibacillus sp. VKM B-2647]KIL38355.1 type II secretion system protein [Paenibacillus sp. VKM B-2647]